MKNATKQDAVAEVCLYGARSCGFGWLGQMYDGTKFGNAELKFESASLAIENACRSIPTSLARTDAVLIFDMGGLRVARTNAWGPQTYGDLDWKDAPQFVISADALVAAAKQQKATADALDAAVAAVPDMVNALGVIVNDATLFAAVSKIDPMAAAQVLGAFKRATGKVGS